MYFEFELFCVAGERSFCLHLFSYGSCDGIDGIEGKERTGFFRLMARERRGQCDLRTTAYRVRKLVDVAVHWVCWPGMDERDVSGMDGLVSMPTK